MAGGGNACAVETTVTHAPTSPPPHTAVLPVSVNFSPIFSHRVVFDTAVRFSVRRLTRTAAQNGGGAGPGPWSPRPLTARWPGQQGTDPCVQRWKKAVVCMSGHAAVVGGGEARVWGVGAWMQTESTGWDRLENGTQSKPASQKRPFNRWREQLVAHPLSYRSSSSSSS